jgi:hypothetical protein
MHSATWLLGTIMLMSMLPPDMVLQLATPLYVTLTTSHKRILHHCVIIDPLFLVQKSPLVLLDFQPSWICNTLDHFEFHDLGHGAGAL